MTAICLLNFALEYFTEDERSLTHELLNETPNEDRTKTIMALTFASRCTWLSEARPPMKTLFSTFPPLRNIYSSAAMLLHLSYINSNNVIYIAYKANKGAINRARGDRYLCLC